MLPNLFLLSDTKGEWDSYLNGLYQIYLDEIINGALFFKQFKVSSRRTPETQGKHFGFWHVISTGETEADRIPDLRRCERIHWIAYLITHVEIDPEISWWENKRGSDTRIVIWHELENFVVILGTRKDYYVLVTAYCPESGRTKGLIKERTQFWQGRKS